jgi:hypothetical protein
MKAELKRKVIESMKKENIQLRDSVSEQKSTMRITKDDDDDDDDDEVKEVQRIYTFMSNWSCWIGNIYL